MYPKYEFKQQLLSDQCQRALVRLYQLFANEASSALSSFFQTPFHIAFETLEQIPFSLYLATLPQPSIAATLSILPLTGKGIIEINPQLCYSAISLMLGGEGDVPRFFPPMSPLEMAANRQFFHKLLKILEKAWKPLVDLKLTIDKIGSLAEQSDFSTEQFFLIARLHAQWKSASGLLSFGLPIATLELIYRILEDSSQHILSEPHPPVTSIDLNPIEVELKARLGTINISREDLKTFRIGDVLLLEQNIHHPIDIIYGEQIPFQGIPGLIGTHKGIFVN